MSADQIQRIRRDQVRLMPGYVTIMRKNLSPDDQGGASGGGSVPVAVARIPARVRPLFGQAGEAAFGERIASRDNFVISVPFDSPQILTMDQLVYQAGNQQGDVTFEVKSIDNAKGEWDTVRRIITQRTSGGGTF